MPPELAVAQGEDDPTVVALVASAGGIRAVWRILERLPTGFPAAVIVLVHQSPDRLSRLTPILEAHCALPVGVAEDDRPLTASTVVVIPPGVHLLLTAERRTLLIPSGAFPPNRPSADLLLASLATAIGPRAIAVVLSGTGHDGATGATAVHARGGQVVATDEATSQEFSMPSATIERDSVIDHVVALDDVADLLVTLTSPELSSPGRASG